jgi:hypothetical protein
MTTLTSDALTPNFIWDKTGTEHSATFIHLGKAEIALLKE